MTLNRINRFAERTTSEKSGALHTHYLQRREVSGAQRASHNGLCRRRCFSSVLLMIKLVLFKDVLADIAPTNLAAGGTWTVQNLSGSVFSITSPTAATDGNPTVPMEWNDPMGDLLQL